MEYFKNPSKYKFSFDNLELDNSDPIFLVTFSAEHKINTLNLFLVS